MSLTASRAEDGPSVSLPPSLDPGDPNDPSHTLPSFTFVMYQLSVLLSSLGSTANDAFARQQLLAALSNVLCASLQLRQHTPSPAPSSIPVVQAAPTQPRSMSPSTEPSLSPSPSLPPSPPSPPASIHTIRILTPVEPFTAPLRSRHSRRSRKRRVRSCPSSPVPSKRPSPADALPLPTDTVPMTSSPTVPLSSPNPFAPLAADDADDAAPAEQTGSDDFTAHITYKVSAGHHSVAQSVSAVIAPSSSAASDAMVEGGDGDGAVELLVATGVS